MVDVDEKHVEWKEPVVEKVHAYEQIPKGHVRWKDPVVQGKYRYPKVPKKIGPLPDFSASEPPKGSKLHPSPD